MTTGDEAPSQDAPADGEPSEPSRPATGREPEPELAPELEVELEPERKPEPEPAAVGGEPVRSSSPAAGRFGSLAIHDRRRAGLGVATAVALVVAGGLGLQLLRALSGDEGSTATEPVPGAVGKLVPHVIALTEPPPRPDAPEVFAALTAARHDVAVDTTVAALCATVTVAEPVTVAGRWERNGELVASSRSSSLGPPGFADCIDADGEPLPEGAYQFVVTDEEGAVSAPGTIVLGAPVVPQSFVNDTDEPVCGLRLAPLRAAYFELFDASAEPIAPGAAVTVPLAGVRQSLEAVACDDGATLATAQVRPDARAARAITSG